MNIEQQILSDITIYLKYAKYLPEKNRRETWEEIITRNKEMHIRKFPQLKEEIENAYKLVYDKKILPSMRSVQFAGKVAEINNARMYNCCYLPVDDYRSFSEALFLLLTGCGVGYSVQSHHIDELPEIRKPIKPKRYLIGDSIEGWADAVKALCKAYFGKTMTYPLFDYRDIRPKGAALVTTGGKAPGPEPLKIALTHIESIFNRKKDGDKLTSLECHDIICHLADAVLGGGIRRAALISLFDLTDEDMLTCKFGNWWEQNPQRGRANNTAVITKSRIDKETFLNLWKKIELSNSGEPGFMFTNNNEYGLNPCISGNTWVTTINGPLQVKELIGIKTQLLKDGNFYNTTEDGFWCNGIKPIYELKLDKGYTIRATENHKFLTDNGWKELKDISVINDKIFISNNENIINWNGYGGTKEEGWLLGNLIGDGTFSSEDNAILQYWGDNKFKMKELAYNSLKNCNLFEGEEFYTKTEYSEKYNKTSINSKKLAHLANLWGVKKGDKHFNDLIEKSSSEFYRGIIGGLFDADGSVYISNGGINVDISQSNLDMLQRCQRMLLRLGIQSKISLSHKEGNRLCPGPNFYDNKEMKEYYCSNNYILRISNKLNVSRFFDLFYIKDELKLKKYKNLISKYILTYKNNYKSKILSITYIGEEKVYDCTIPEISSFEANGIITHNCGEIALKPKQFCNLVEINASNIETQEDLNERTKAAAFIGTLQASYTDFHYLREDWKKTTEKEALLGIGMTGIASGNVLKLNLTEAAEVAKAENERVANIININKAARITTVKPSGTTSLVLGTSSGIHAWHDNFYLRRIRIGKNEAIYNYLLKNHSELVEDDFFKSQIQAIISIPQKAPDNAITRKESTFDLLERIKKFNKEWILPGHRRGGNTHNVSATVTIKQGEWGKVGEWLFTNRNYFTALSFLPEDLGTYIQAPFETINEEKYNEIISHLHAIDLTKITEIEDNTDLVDQAACVGGSCEIV